MSRYIDADAFEINMQNKWEHNEISNGEWVHFREMINDEPTADVVPVVHGWWETVDDHYLECSICGAASNYESPYCSECGAKLEGAEDG